MASFAVGARGTRLGRALFVTGLEAVLLLVGGSATRADNGTGDSFTPNADVTIGVGASKTLNPTLHLGQLPGKADILFAFDTTGSMGQAITDARVDADHLVNRHQAGDSALEVRGRRFQGLPGTRTVSAVRATTRGASTRTSLRTGRTRAAPSA